MKSRRLMWFTATILLGVIAIPGRVAAQDEHDQPPKHHHYKLIDLGTLGGPHSYGSVNGDGFQLLNDSGEVASSAELATPDPNAAFGCSNPNACRCTPFAGRTPS